MASERHGPLEHRRQIEKHLHCVITNTRVSHVTDFPDQSVKYTTKEKTMHEILEDDENVGAPGSWASPRLDENHHTSARRFRLPIKGVFPFDAPPRRYLLFFFFSLCYSRRRFTLRRRHSPCGRGFLCIGERGATLVRVSRVHGSFSLYTRVSVYPLL